MFATIIGEQLCLNLITRNLYQDASTGRQEQNHDVEKSQSPPTHFGHISMHRSSVEIEPATTSQNQPNITRNIALHKFVLIAAIVLSTSEAEV